MSTKNLAMVVGSYDNTAQASEDYQALRSGQDSGGYEIIGAVVLTRDEDGKVQVKEHGDKSVGRGAAIGAGAGVVIGLFAPPLLAATAVESERSWGRSRRIARRSSSASTSMSTSGPAHQP
jgi:uncharacterized membrane protein